MVTLCNNLKLLPCNCIENIVPQILTSDILSYGISVEFQMQHSNIPTLAITLPLLLLPPTTMKSALIAKCVTKYFVLHTNLKLSKSLQVKPHFSTVFCFIGPKLKYSGANLINQRLILRIDSFFFFCFLCYSQRFKRSTENRN